VKGALRHHVGSLTETHQAPQRRDALRNRDAILDAARALFAQSGEVPMCEVARRAGVGQATLYRHFPDRVDLAAALLAEEIDDQEQLAAEHIGDPDAFFVLLRRMVESVVRCRLVSELARRGDRGPSELDGHHRRLRELMRQPMRDAKTAGTLRRDVTIDDVFLVLAMVKGALGQGDTSLAQPTAAGRALAIVLDGLTPAAQPT
jgi:AcrR family transcriptional regulator